MTQMMVTGHSAEQREKLESMLRTMPVEVRRDEPMVRHTSLKVGGPADVMLFPRQPEALQGILRLAKLIKTPLFLLGGGTNLLVKDGGIGGVTIKLSRFNQIQGDGGRIYVEAGVPCPRLIRFSLEKGLTGLEFAYGIPGSLGGMIVMNAGTPEGEIAEVVERAKVMLLDGEIVEIGCDEIEFGYRSSRLPRGIILGAWLKLKKAKRSEVQERIERYMKRRDATQPIHLPNAGSIFKNPPGDHAGRLIEAVGLKGMRLGDAQISDKHANFIVNRGKATARDVLKLIKLIGKTVEEQTGITLELEIRIVGRD
jgi:UDP-N-acetylmuramate dehydrogenase